MQSISIWILARVKKGIKITKLIKWVKIHFICSTFLVWSQEYAVSIATVFHNEAPYLKEWIEYHLSIGIDHFWLYNDCSDDEWEKIIQPYIEQGIVEVIDWSYQRNAFSYWPTIQQNAYKDALSRAIKKSAWLALIDTDEFIHLKKGNQLPTLLKKYYRNADAIIVQWLLFGTSRITLSPTDSLLENLTSCSSRSHPWNCVGKTIVRPEKANYELMKTVHHVPLCSSGRWFNGSGKEIFMKNDDFSFVSHEGDLLRLNHYFFRDEKYFREVKIGRKLTRNMTLNELYELYDLCNQRHNREILKKLRSLNLSK